MVVQNAHILTPVPSFCATSAEKHTDQNHLTAVRRVGLNAEVFVERDEKSLQSDLHGGKCFMPQGNGLNDSSLQKRQEW